MIAIWLFFFILFEQLVANRQYDSKIIRSRPTEYVEKNPLLFLKDRPYQELTNDPMKTTDTKECVSFRSLFTI